MRRGAGPGGADDSEGVCVAAASGSRDETKRQVRLRLAR